MQTSEVEQTSISVTNAAAAPEPTQVDLLELLVVLARRKKFIATIAAAGAVIGIVVALLIPARYTSTATILPPSETQSTAAMLMSQLAGSGVGALAALAGQDLGLKNTNDLYIGMLKSRTVKTVIVQKFDLQHVYRHKKMYDTLKALDKYSDINTGKEGMINISVEDKDPKRAAEMANTYVDELRTLVQQLAVTEASKRRLFFEQQLQDSKDRLADAEVALKETQQRTGMIQLDSQARAVIAAIVRMRAEIAAKEVQLHAMGSFATDQNPDYMLVQQELVGLRKQLAKFEQQQPGDMGDPLVATGTIPAVGLEWVRRYRDVKYREAVFEIMAKQYEAAKLDEAKQAAIIQLVDPPIPAEEKSSPQRTLIVLGALFLGGLLGMIWVLLDEAYRRMCQDDHMREQVVQLQSYLRLRRRNLGLSETR